MTFNDDFILSSSRNFIEHHFDEMVFLIISQINFFVGIIEIKKSVKEIEFA